MHVSPGPSGNSATSGIGLEPNVLLSSIQKLVQDNQSLQAEVSEKNKRLDEQNERIFSLLNTNSKYVGFKFSSHFLFFLSLYLYTLFAHIFPISLLLDF